MSEPSIEELQEEFAEFKLTSQALEAELELELAETEQRTLQLEQELNSARKDVEYWRQRAERSTEEASRAQQQLVEQTEAMRTASRRTQERLVAVERDNDDMERTGREKEEYVHELVRQNARLLEQLAIAEAEAREGAIANEELHRTREDLQDANDEIARLQRARPASTQTLSIPKSQSLRRVAGIIDQVTVLEGHVATVRKRFGSEGTQRPLRKSGYIQTRLDLRLPTAVGHARAW